MPKPTALESFVAAKAEIDRRLARLQKASDEHFGRDPETIDWGHVGDLNRLTEFLVRATDAAFNETEAEDWDL